MDAADDPIVADHREQITAIDTEILDAVNRRILLVASLHAHKREQGYPTIDAGREAQLLEELRTRNPGPMSDQALERLERLILELCTAEAARIAARQAEPA
jgi:chorismate mutase / prephenate dehydratase